MKMATKQSTHVIYIPGLGDGYDPMRRFFLGLWHYRNITTELVPMLWSVDNGFESKRQQVYEAIGRAVAQNKRVVLMGESAGGSMAVNVYAERTNDIARVVTLCGKNTHPETVALRYFRKNPAFRSSVNILNKSISMLDKKAQQHFTSIHPIYDPVVPVNETFLEHCRHVQIFAYGHLIPILLCLSIYSAIVVREVRRTTA